MLIATGEEAAILTAFGGFMWLMVCFWIVFALVGIALLVFWIIAIVDCAQRKLEEFPQGGESAKTTWLVILLVSWIAGLNGVAGIVYYFMVIRKNPRGKSTNIVPPPQPPQS